MEEALKRTYDATPDPKIVVALGDCAGCGGVYGEGYASRGRIANVIPVTHIISGCPPSPAAIMAGILQALATR
jgi:Ni,Fe-hydrogenase III small subunit